ncbi:MAG: CotH kinase family protein, partial [Saprospiraceae bacterium]
YPYGEQLTDVSEGRSPAGMGAFAFYFEPTPGAPNGIPNNGPAAAVEASQVAGLYASGLTVALNTTTPNATIYYTTDGTIPTESSSVYSVPLTFTTTTNLRAVATAPAFSASEPSTFSYLIDVSHTFPIISFTSDPDDFFGQENGLFPNFTRDIETPIHVEMFEPNGNLAFSQVMEVEIQGTGSAVLPQKSLAMKAKGSLGSSTIDYPVFPSRGFTQYRSLVVRNSGQDYNLTHFRDAMASSLVDDLSDVEGMIKMPNLTLQAYRPGIVYINGAYWGMQNLRERMDKRYLKVHFDLDDDEIDFLDEQNDVRDGDTEAWDNLQQFLLNNSLSNAANFNTVADQVDLDAYRDYLIFNVFVDNADWPANNNRRWRERVPDGKWRWMVKDLDFSFGLFVAPGSFNTNDFTQNSLRRLLTISQSWPNVEWSTRLFRRLTENDQWRADFLNRMADQLNIFYNSERVVNRIDEFRTRYFPER